MEALELLEQPDARAKAAGLMAVMHALDVRQQQRQGRRKVVKDFGNGAVLERRTRSPVVGLDYAHRELAPEEARRILAAADPIEPVLAALPYADPGGDRVDPVALGLAVIEYAREVADE